MPSTAATEPDYENSKLNLLACLALYQHRQDQANGISWASGRAREFVRYYKLTQSKELSDLFSAAYYNGIIQQGVSDIAEIAKQAETADNKKVLLDKAITIQGIIKAAEEALNELAKRQK